MPVDAAGEIVRSNELRQCASNHLTPPFSIRFSETPVSHYEGDVLTEKPNDELVPRATLRIRPGTYGFECHPCEHGRRTFALIGVEASYTDADGVVTDLEL